MNPASREQAFRPHLRHKAARAKAFNLRRPSHAHRHRRTCGSLIQQTPADTKGDGKMDPAPVMIDLPSKGSLALSELIINSAKETV